MTDNPKPIQRWLLLLIAALLALLAVSVPHQRMIGDEAWLGEQAYLLAHDGVMRSELFRGYAMQEERILITHKLYIALGAVMTALFGWGITPLRVLSLLGGALALCLIIVELRKESALAGRLGVVALLAMPLFFKYVNLYRPEVMLAAVGLSSYVMLSRYLSHERTRYLVLSAALAGLAALVHVNGVIYAAAAGVVLALHKRFSMLTLYTVVAAAVAALYFVDVVGHWDMLFSQLHQVPSLTADDFKWSTPFWRVLDEHKRLFRKPEIIFTTVLFIASFVYAWIRIPRTRRTLLPYCLVAIIGLGAVAQAKTTPYAIALLPLFALVVGHATSDWMSSFRTSPRWVVALGAMVWAAFLVHSLTQNTITALSDKANVAADNRQIAEALPRDAIVLASMEFIFNEIERFDIRAVMAAELILAGHHDADLTMTQINDYARERNITAYVFNARQRQRFGLADARLGDRYGSFVVVLITNNGTIALVRSSGVRYGRQDAIPQTPSPLTQNVAT